jgi:hypothetical protein
MADTTSPAVFVKFGQPAHGWLPVMFQAGTFQLAFNASDVPANPLELLCEALAVVPAGGSAEVIWHLEPAIYRFSFEKQVEEIILEIIEAPKYSKPGTCVLQLTGSVRSILFPFYKALTAFAAHQYGEAQWPALAASRLKLIRQLLRSQY